MPPFDTTTSVKDLMANVVDPTADESGDRSARS
jgi:hypothetical protein